MRLVPRGNWLGEAVGLVRAVESALEGPLEGAVAWAVSLLPAAIDSGVVIVRCGDMDAARTFGDERDCCQARGGDRGGAATDCTVRQVAAGSSGPEKRLARGPGQVVAAGATVELPLLKWARQVDAGLPGCEVCNFGCAATGAGGAAAAGAAAAAAAAEGCT
mmetsp:Transcript_79384/g.157294  ORF Transcript_79384/g.157294 Transcript_79384/m.157294 type:complete len:162 (+) Transcript_79384:1193-1678(+)